MKFSLNSSLPRIFTVAVALGWSGLSHAQTATGEQRTHGINAPAINIGPSPGEGTPDPRDRDDNAINSKSATAGARPGHGSSPAEGSASNGTEPRSELSGTAQTEGQNTSGIWPFAIPIAAIFVGVPLAFMFWMRRSQSNR